MTPRSNPEQRSLSEVAQDVADTLRTLEAGALDALADDLERALTASASGGEEDEHGYRDPFKTVKRLFGESVSRLSVPGTDKEGMQVIEVGFRDDRGIMAQTQEAPATRRGHIMTMCSWSWGALRSYFGSGFQPESTIACDSRFASCACSLAASSSKAAARSLAAAASALALSAPSLALAISVADARPAASAALLPVTLDTSDATTATPPASAPIQSVHWLTADGGQPGILNALSHQPQLPDKQRSLDRRDNGERYSGVGHRILWGGLLTYGTVLAGMLLLLRGRRALGVGLGVTGAACGWLLAQGYFG
jgi:hypothetical protein